MKITDAMRITASYGILKNLVGGFFIRKNVTNRAKKTKNNVTKCIE